MERSGGIGSDIAPSYHENIARRNVIGRFSLLTSELTDMQFCLKNRFNVGMRLFAVQ